MSTWPVCVRRRGRRATALLVLGVLLLTACSSSAEPDRAAGRATTQPTTAVGADATRSRAAELQAGLTHLLVERVHVTAAARSAVGEAQRDDGAAALDEVSVSLADLLGATYTGAREPLLGALRAVDRRGLQQADAAGAPATAAALRRLRTAQDELAGTVRRVVPRLDAEQVRVRLEQDLAAQLAVGGDDPYARVRTAAAGAVQTARMLSVGVADDRALGPAATRAATLRAQLTGLLTEHVLLAGAVAREQSRTGGARSSAIRALEANGGQLTAVLGTVYPALPAQFGPSWEGHVARLVALASGSTPVRQRLVLAYPTELGALLGRHVTGLPPGTTAVEVEPLLQALVRAVEAGSVAAPDAHAALRRATQAVPAPSALLAAAIAQDRRYR